MAPLCRQSRCGRGAQIELSAVDALARKYDLQFREFGASGSLEAGKLEVHSISGRIGNSLLRDGHLTATLSDDFMVQRADLIAQRGDHVLQADLLRGPDGRDIERLFQRPASADPSA